MTEKAETGGAVPRGEALGEHSDAGSFVERLDLAEDPFSTSFRGEYFFSAALRRHTLDQLVHFSRFSDQLVVLTGAAGSGKTLLIDMAVNQLNAVMDCCRSTAAELASPEQVLSVLAEQLNLAAGAAESVGSLVTGLQALASSEQGREPVLVVIERAEELSRLSVELLLEVHWQADGVIHLLLVGTAQAQRVVAIAGADINQVRSFELPALSQGEVGQYLLGRLQSVGYAGEQPLSSDQLAVLYEQSAGNIAEINHLAAALLQEDSSTSSAKPMRMAMPAVHLAAIVVLVVALLLSYLYQGDEEPRTTVSTALPTPVLVDGAPEEASQPSLVRSSLPEVLTRPELETSPGELTAAKPVRELPVQKPAVAPAPVKAPAIETVAAQEPVESSVPSPVVSEPVVPAKPVAAAPPPKAVVAPTAQPNPLPAREQRLLGMAADQYMLQLLGAREEQRARDFVKQYVGRFPLTYFQTSLNDRPWYVVVTGPYPGREQAAKAIGHLPEKLQSQQPWIRSVASVQADIRSNRQ